MNFKGFVQSSQNSENSAMDLETNSKSVEKTDQQTSLKEAEPSTSKADASDSFDYSAATASSEKDSAMSSKVVEVPSKGCAKTVSEDTSKKFRLIYI